MLKMITRRFRSGDTKAVELPEYDQYKFTRFMDDVEAIRSRMLIDWAVSRKSKGLCVYISTIIGRNIGPYGTTSAQTWFCENFRRQAPESLRDEVYWLGNIIDDLEAHERRLAFLQMFAEKAIVTREYTKWY